MWERHARCTNRAAAIVPNQPITRSPTVSAYAMGASGEWLTKVTYSRPGPPRARAKVPVKGALWGHLT